ncbi:MAG: VOC family protein [Beijerinckiaceae bacterium]|nr:VOC family protein [Beijerinckiaceae bacterium]
MQRKIVPEFDVEDLERSLVFYVDVIGFNVMFMRPEDQFAYLDFDGAQLMLEQIGGSGRRFSDAAMEHPYGRGINLQIEVADVDAVHRRVQGAGLPILIALEERWYRQGSQSSGNRQFVVADPDGYLLRFYSDLGFKTNFDS